MTAIDPARTLGALPKGLRDELVAEYRKVTRNYVQRNWEASELDGGRFCEIVHSVLRGHVDGTFPASAAKPPNFPLACERLAHADKFAFPQSVRIGIPRILLGLYEVRNNRGVGHVGGDVNANHMDATYVLHGVQWVMAELIRIFHCTDVTAATELVGVLTDRTLPVVWETGTRRRVLADGIRLRDKTLLLLYGAIGRTSAKDLAADLKQSRFANFKRVLVQLDDDVLVEYDSAAEEVEISPKGEKQVEMQLLPMIHSA